MLNIGSIGIAVAAVVALLALWTTDRAVQRSVGASNQNTKIVRATDYAISKGKRAASASASDGVRGQRDPTTRDD